MGPADVRATGSMSEPIESPRILQAVHAAAEVRSASIVRSPVPVAFGRSPVSRTGASRVTIFTIWFQNFPNNLVILIAAAAIAGGFVFVFARSAMVAEGGRQGWSRRVTGPNAKLLFAALFVVWALVFGVGLQLVPHEGASSPYGGLGLIALFSGFFIMMGLIWSVIGD